MKVVAKTWLATLRCNLTRLVAAATTSCILTYLFRYESFAREISRELPGDLSNKKFVHYRGIVELQGVKQR